MADLSVAAPSAARSRRLDYELIEGLVPRGSRVLDLGCGDGSLLAQLASEKRCRGSGIEIDEQAVLQCIERGVAVYHGDMLEGMDHYEDGAFDLVILSQTLQQTEDPVRVMREMLRVGGTAIISFPNYGYWRIRLQLLLGGRMPRTNLLPYAWHQTPDVHVCTVNDFRSLCRQLGMRIVRELFVVPGSRQIGAVGANWRAALAIFQLQGVPADSAPVRPKG
jgi:methionine biosynthesis protein MetW